MKTAAERQLSIQKHIIAIINEMNVMGIDEKELGEAISTAISSEHKTLQQTFFRVFQQTVTHYGKYAYVDRRNQGSRDWANAASEIQVALPFV